MPECFIPIADNTLHASFDVSPFQFRPNGKPIMRQTPAMNLHFTWDIRRPER
jgi:hypothetical protein